MKQTYPMKMKKTASLLALLLALVLSLSLVLCACDPAGNGGKTNAGEQSGTSEQTDKEQHSGSGTASTDSTTSAMKGSKNATRPASRGVVPDPGDLPAFQNRAYCTINGGVPTFAEAELSLTSYEFYSPLDFLKRCGYAVASVGQDIMPTEKRGDISSVKPTGWVQAKYSSVSGGYLYNRCHLIGYQLTGENANKQNLITGTRYMNEAMIPYENMVADYVKETNRHVMYRVDPIFIGDNLVASGVHMEAWSVEDGGDGICFNVFLYNVQPGIEIDYATGESRLAGTAMIALVGPDAVIWFAEEKRCA